MKFLSTTITVFCIFLLTACGGGGGGGGGSDSSTPAQPTNTSPAVNISGAADADSGDVISLTANAADSDGTIASYAWSVDSGSITLSDASKAQVSFTAPNVESDTAISLSVTVSDNKGATAKATKQITVKKKVSLTITGLVLDGGAVPNADVSFKVGDSTFTTKANAAGQYSITISAGSKNFTTPVLATAVGDATNPKIKLVSQLNSVSKLTEQAGSDNILEAKENLSVNISNVTTAEYAILKEPNWWGFITPIATDEQLQSAQKSIGSSSKVFKASYLQIIATDSRFKLPDTSKNTLDFLQNQDAVDAFRDQVYATDPALIPNTQRLIEPDKNLINTKPSITGQYLLYDKYSSDHNSFRLTLNKDFTGILESATYSTSLTWVQDGSKVTLSFPTPIETGETGFNGAVLINKAELNIYNDYPSYSLFILSKSDGRQTPISLVVYDTSKFVPLTEEKVVGEWMSDYGSYIFNSDKSSLFKEYNKPNASTVSSWSIGNNKLVLKASDNVSNSVGEELYLLEDLGVGYSYLRLSIVKNLPFRFSDGVLIKPQTNLQLKKADFVGNWIDPVPYGTNRAEIRVMSSDNQGFTNFAAWPYTWSSIEGSNTWGKNVYRQNGEWMFFCDLSVGTLPDCQLFRNYTNKVIAVHGDQYYSLQTVTEYTTPNQSYVNSSLVQSTKLPEITYFGGWIDNSILKVFYQKTADGIKVWNFKDNRFIINNKSLDLSGFVKFSGDAITFAWKNNRLQYTRDGIARELMLVSASENGLTVCEYNQGASCISGTEFLLSNRSPAKISLKVEGSGTITYSGVLSNPDTDALFGNALQFTLTPDAGALVKSVTGCGGKLDGDRYITLEIRDACTITATFTQLPVVTLKAGVHGAIKKLAGYQYTITPDANYMVDTATGCNGTLTDGQSPLYTLNAAPAADCTITVSFKQKLSVEAKITDPGLASCLDASNIKNIAAVYDLNCKNIIVRSLEGIQHLTGLSRMSLPYVASSTPLVIPEINTLESLIIGSQDLSLSLDIASIDVSRAKNIKIIAIWGTQIHSLNLNGLNKLESVDIMGNSLLENLDLSEANLTIASIVGNGLVNVVLPKSGRLEHLNLTQNKITNIDLTSSRKLTTLYISNNQLTQLDLSNNSELSTFFASANQLKTISLANLEKLYYVDISNNQLSSIELQAASKLEILRINSNNLTTLNASKFTGKVEITAYDNKLKTISGLESVATDSSIDLHSNSFDANTLAYLNNLKTVKNYTKLMY